ncbi:MAG: ADP-forming succinate--CoA ligase subunit beta [Firmicutes bacterium]|nr:ADP-forming succinate--CoA ligase subunit beta [Bacillota bacterium]
MKLYEYLAKGILRQAGVPTAPGEVVDTPEQARAAAERIGPAAVKAQVLVGGRGKAGGIRFGNTPAEVEAAARAILGMDLKGYRVERLYVEGRLDIAQELYVSISTDRGARRPLVMASAKGGVEIEEVADEDIVRRHLDVEVGAWPYVGREVARSVGLEGAQAAAFADIVTRLYDVYRRYDAELVEINPLVVAPDGRLVAADARLNVDDAAAFRHPDLPVVEEGTELERRVRAIGLAYVELDGDIAVMANGAGMAMATLDAIQHYGGRPANFLDAGGGASVEPTAQALEVLVSMHPKVIFINIFGGITRCDDVARALLQVRASRGIPVPVVVRLVGTNEEEGVRLLREAGIEAFRDMGPAAEKAVALAGGRS